MAEGIIEKINDVKKIITIAGKDYPIKKAWNREELGKKLKIGTKIKYNLKGPNLEFQKIISGSKEDIFDYPYNFVGSNDNVNRETIQKGEYSGKMKCTLKNMTPLFISGIKKEDSNGHVTEYFMKDKNDYIIPSTTLKGTIRSVLEAVSNSCYSNIKDERLEERKGAGHFKDKKYGIIKRLPTKIEDGLIEEAEVIKVWNANGKNKEHLKKYSIPQKYRKEGVYDVGFSNKLKNYKTGDIIESEDEFKNLMSDRNQIEGKLWISSEMYNKKKDKLLYTTSNSKSYTLSFEEYDDINYIITQRKERDKKVDKNFYFNELKEGDVIIFQAKNNQAKNLAFSEIPRLRYKLSYYDLIEKKLRACTKIENACYACRIFGMIGNSNETKQEEDIESSIGKVYFSDAKIKKEKAVFIPNGKSTIKALGEPHPTLISFYLQDSKHDYNDKKAKLRGRKFYWHHKDKINKKYDEIKNSIESKEGYKPYNSTLEIMETGNKFNFEVEFKNLTKDELGLLIYSLNLEKDMLHKIGRAKALGLGSSKININKIELENSKQKYLKFSKTDINLENMEDIINIFKEKIGYNNSSQKKELDSIMNINNNLDFSETAFPEETGKLPGKTTVNWFMNRKNKGKYPPEFKLPKILDYK